MHHAAVLLLAALSASAVAQAPSTALSADECAVWARELSFAQSVQDHDAAAFAAHLHADAVFGVGDPAPTRGPEAITQR